MFRRPSCFSRGAARDLPLGAALLAATLCLSLPATGLAETLKVGGTGAALGTMRVLAKAFMKSRPGVSVVVPASLGSGGGIRAVTAGALDIGLSSRPLKDRERAAGARQHGYARTPFALVTANGRPATALTSAEVVRIYAGDRTRWNDGTPIRIILRPEDDSDTTSLIAAFADIGPALAKARRTHGIPVLSTDQQTLDRAEILPGSFATTTLAAVIAEGRALDPITIDGIDPTVENLANGSYRFAKTL